jgi:hypothetical protein
MWLFLRQSGNFVIPQLRDADLRNEFYLSS